MSLRFSASKVLSGLLLVLVLCGSASTPPSENAAFEGQWALVKEQSSPVDPWDRLSLRVNVDGPHVVIERIWWDRSYKDYEVERTDSLAFRTGGEVNRIPLKVWPDDRHLGAWAVSDTTKEVRARWEDDGRTLIVISRLSLRTSQGTKRIRTHTEYRLAPDESRLYVLELRSTRQKPIRYVFERTEKEAS